MGGGNVEPNTSTIVPDLGTTSIPYQRRKDNMSWWQQLVIVFTKVSVIFLILAALIQMYVRMDRNISIMEAKALEMQGEIIKLGSRTDMLVGKLESLDKYFSGKEELNRFFEDYNKRKLGGNVDLNEVMVLTRDIVTMEIEKHAADGLGRVDYALATAGAFVMKHSRKPHAIWNRILGIPIWLSEYMIDPDSVRMITPSFVQPGQCFAMEGNSGFIQIKLTKAIIPQAVTLEHVAKSVLDDRSSAPKDCMIYGWLTGDSRMYLLGKFTYDLEKSRAQTFNVSDSSRVINIIRLDITSNHGNPFYTSIYRFRMHGYQPHI